METGWEQKHLRRTMAAMLGACVFGWLYILLPFAEPWSWLLLGIEIAFAIVLIGLLVRLVRRRREEYWHEREKDK